MTNIRRFINDEYIYFLTHVTYKRRPILVKHFDLLMESIISYQKKEKYELISWVVLPDHMHLLIKLRDKRLPELMRKIKLSFSMKLRKRLQQRGGRIWQYRYWDHVIRDKIDLNTHIDYIHYNPVKHGYTKRPFDWKYSSMA
ncbi:MAG: transposase [candidate division Zixibacteria bacterium]|nr:transposase [candidate division Zixibacteria bacterium]